MAPRVLAIASHPIQYHAPWFRALAASGRFDFEVLFVEQPDAVQQGRGFGVPFEWDIPLLQGYRSTFAGKSVRRGWGEGFARLRLHDARALMRRLAPQVVVLTGWHTATMVQLLAAASAEGIPVVMRAEANALRRRAPHVRAFHRWLLARCTAFMPIGRGSRDFYSAYGIPADRLFDAPYFVDNDRFVQAARELQPQRGQLRARWGIPDDAVCFCFAGKLEPKKRPLDLLAALRAAVPRAGNKLHLLVVGNGELMSRARHMAESHSLPVTFAGFLNQTEIPQAYIASDALVLPSGYGETWGLVVNEAMACGRAAIVSDRVGCAADLVTGGETGKVFPFGDVAALADCLVSAAADPAALASMGARARERVLAGYNVARCTEGTLRAVEHVLSQR